MAAEHQSKLLSKLKEEFSLTEKEKQILTRGRNSGSGRNNNRRDPVAYQDSTAFEAVLGYMYIASPGRCEELLSWIGDNVDTV
jgi:ribonuclease III family protein